MMLNGWDQPGQLSAQAGGQNLGPSPGCGLGEGSVATRGVLGLLGSSDFLVDSSDFFKFVCQVN
jgi:hypothetical protein